jgi:hypothetical protein
MFGLMFRQVDANASRSFASVNGPAAEVANSSSSDPASALGHEAEFKNGENLLAAALEILRQGEDLLSVLPRERYTQRVPSLFNSCIGSHYRYCLAHFARLVLALESGEVDCDLLERDPRLEIEPGLALQITRCLRAQLQFLSPADLAYSVRRRSEFSLTRDGSPATSSTLGGELVYATAQAVHHYSLISMIAGLLDVTLPPHFGIAPSTVRPREHKSGNTPTLS